MSRLHGGRFFVAAIASLLLPSGPASAVDQPPPETSPASSTAAAFAPQEKVFANARLSLREDRPQDVLRLWLLRNALRLRGEVGKSDGDFRSVVWASLGKTGYCPDGFIEDDDGAGLWPLATHNWFLKNLNKEPPLQPEPWSSFRGGMQQRQISLHDVLSLEEMKSVRFYRAFCLTPWLLQPRLTATTGSLQWTQMDDRISVGSAMLDLLMLAEQTLDPQKTEGWALLATRRFDLEVALTRLRAARARQQTSVFDQALRASGVSAGGRLEARQARTKEFASSTEAELWRSAMSWPASEWLSLSTPRRLSLFADASRGLRDEERRARVILHVVDALIDRGEGSEIEAWLGFAGELVVDDAADAVTRDKTVAWREFLLDRLSLGNRGERLLGLEPATGYRERSAIALRRGVQAVKAGSTIAALRAFAFSLAHANESSDAEQVHRVSQRWLAFVLGQYQTNEEVVAILERFVPQVDLPLLVEALLWRAAFHRDTASFVRLVDLAENKKLPRVVELADRLQPLSEGDPGRMWKKLVGDLPDAARVRFAERLVEQLSLETFDIRSNQRDTLLVTLEVLDDVHQRGAASQRRKLEALRGRVQGLRDAVGAYDESVRGRINERAPDKETYGGSVRLAPADPLPWPFVTPALAPPQPFSLIQLTPVEWRQGDGRLVYGWRIHE